MTMFCCSTTTARMLVSFGHSSSRRTRSSSVHSFSRWWTNSARARGGGSEAIGQSTRGPGPKASTGLYRGCCLGRHGPPRGQREVRRRQRRGGERNGEAVRDQGAEPDVEEVRERREQELDHRGGDPDEQERDQDQPEDVPAVAAH